MIAKIICWFYGHKWGKKEIGWQLNPDFDINKNQPFVNQKMTIAWKHCRCVRCGVAIDWKFRKFKF